MVTSESSPSVNQLPQLLITRRHFPLTEGRLISGKRVAFRQRAERENEFRRLRRLRIARWIIEISIGTFDGFANVLRGRDAHRRSTTPRRVSQSQTGGCDCQDAAERIGAFSSTRNG